MNVGYNAKTKKPYEITGKAKENLNKALEKHQAREEETKLIEQEQQEFAKYKAEQKGKEFKEWQKSKKDK